MKPKSVNWQTLACLEIATGLYACKRIGKLKRGLVLFGVNYLGLLIGSLALTPLLGKGLTGILFYGLWDVTIGIVSIVIPMLFVREWTKTFNLSLLK